MRRFSTTLLLLGLGLCLGTASWAAGDERATCRAEAHKLCPGVAGGDGRLMQCLKDHESAMSPPCKKRLDEALVQAARNREACKGDEEKLCRGIAPGQGHLVQCLYSHHDELSPACQERLDETTKHAPCLPDAVKFCSNVRPGQGAMGKCLKSHEAELSAACRDAHAHQAAKSLPRPAR